MANLTITNTFVAATSAQSAQVNTNFTDIKTWLNNRDNASDYWFNMKVSGTASNPGEIKSSATDCEFDIDCTGTNGTPRISWRRSGSTIFTAGVDGASSNIFNFGTTALGTNVAFSIPASGSQIQLANGTAAAPSVAFISGPAMGMYRVGANILGFSTNSTVRWKVGSTGEFFTDTGNIILSGDGTVNNPSFSFNNSPAMGMYLIGTNILGFATSSTLRMQIYSSGSVIVGSAAIATNASDGFLYIPTCAGAPTGTPTAFTGRVALVYDTTNNKFAVYNAAWKQVTLS